MEMLHSVEEKPGVRRENRLSSRLKGPHYVYATLATKKCWCENRFSEFPSVTAGLSLGFLNFEIN